MLSRERWPLRLGPLPPLLAVAFLWSAALIPRGLGRFSGDAMIHLTFAERLTQGQWLQFNSGEPSAGTTSLLWNLWEACLLATLPTRAALYGIGLTCLLSWAALGLGAYWLCRQLGGTRENATVAALCSAAMPGTLSNAFNGMEAATFGALAVWGLQQALVALEAPPPSKVQLARTTLLLSLGAWIRPEGLALAGVVLGYAASRRPRVALLWGSSVALVGATLLVLHKTHAGVWLPGSGLARVAAARRDPLSLRLGVGPLWVYGRFLVRVVAYAPLLAPIPLYFLRKRTSSDPSHEGGRRVVATVVLVAMLAYATLFGASHTGRYLLWMWALALPLALSLPNLLPRWRALALLAFVAVGSAEVVARKGDPAQVEGPSVEALASALEGREALTQRVLAVAAPRTQARRLGFTEVQARWGLGDELAVDSTDGRTGSRGFSLGFGSDGCPLWPAEAPAGVIFFEAITPTAPRCPFPAWVTRYEQAREGVGDPCWTPIAVESFGQGFVASPACRPRTPSLLSN